MDRVDAVYVEEYSAALAKVRADATVAEIIATERSATDATIRRVGLQAWRAHQAREEARRRRSTSRIANHINAPTGAKREMLLSFARMLDSAPAYRRNARLFADSANPGLRALARVYTQIADDIDRIVELIDQASDGLERLNVMMAELGLEPPLQPHTNPTSTVR